jgi:hypothetical protein
MPSADLYISVDVEADGPIPGPYSMLSVAFAVAGSFDGVDYQPADVGEEVFYRELQPISDQYDPEALAVSGLDRDRLELEGADPADAMNAAGDWIRSIRRRRRPVLVGYPLVFDWMFTQWYFERFAVRGSPFGFSAGLDMKTMYAVKANATVSASTKSRMPAQLLSSLPHSHQALDDAVEQADMFNRLWAWTPRRQAPAGPR